MSFPLPLLDLFELFQRDTLEDYRRGHFYGLEKFWAYLKHRKQAEFDPLDPALREVIANYRSLQASRSLAVAWALLAWHPPFLTF
jgi:la-related protein 1